MKQLNWYQIFGVQIPDGRTVLPTDDIQIWLHCANIWDKNYTTLAEVLADSTTLSALISSNNAVDYLVRSTTWAGISLVPTMTSNTTPSGVCSSSGIYGDYQPFKAFDGNNATFWHSTKTSSSSYQPWIKYDFGRVVSIKAFTLYAQHSHQLRFKTILIEGSNDDVTYTSFYTETTTATEKTNWQGTFAEVNYRYVRITFKNLANVNNEYMAWVNTIQFYPSEITSGICQDSTAMTYIGLNNYCANKLLADATWRTAICNSTYFESVLNVKVPTMTDNTHPSGEAFASSVFNNASIWQPYHCFDNSGYDAGWYCASDVNQAGQYAGYMFTDVKKIYKARIVYTNKNNNSVYKLRGKVSADGSYQDITSNQTKTYPLTKQTDTFIFTSPAEYKYFILYIVSGATYTSGYTPGLTLFEIQFYGREDV